MLLDFSVAEDTKVRGNPWRWVSWGHPVVHGSEHWRRSKAPTARSIARKRYLFAGHALRDAHAPGRLAFANAPSKKCCHKSARSARRPAAAPPLLEQGCRRRQSESMVRHCLEPDPANANQSALELREDVDRQRASLPLKYAPEPSVREPRTSGHGRHPRLASLTSITAWPRFFLGSLAAWSLLHASAWRAGPSSLSRFMRTPRRSVPPERRSMDRDQLEQGIRLGELAPSTYQVLDRPTWQKQPAVRHLSLPPANAPRDLQDLMLLLSRATLLRAAAVADPSQKKCSFETPPA